MSLRAVMTKGALVLALLVSTSGCGVWARMTSTPAEYDAYRSTRMAPTREARLRASVLYLAKHPNGRFTEEVRQRFAEEEQSFFDETSRSREGLDWYLATLPAGPHAVDASLRQNELKQRDGLDVDEALLDRGRRQERRLRLADLSREKALRTFDLWMAGAMRMRSWGEPTHQMPIALISALRLGDDPGHCDDERCIRDVILPFQIPVQGGGLEDRALVMELMLTLENGGVTEIYIRGPAMFSRLWEAERGHPRDPDQETARVVAVGWALSRIEKAFEPVAPAERCNRDITPPVVLWRSCDGWTITVEVGDEATQDDTLRIRGPLSH